MVALGGRVQPVDRVPHDVHGGVEAERVVGALEVVVDRLRHPDDRHPHLVQLAGRRQRPVSAHGDEGVEAVALEVVEELLPVFHHAQRVIAGRAEDRPSLGQDAGDREPGERLDVALDEPEKPVADAEHLYSERQRAPHDGADDGIQPGTIASPGEESDLHSARSGAKRVSVGRIRSKA